MPITQARMLSLLAAAQDYQRGFNTVMERAEEIRGKLTTGQINQDQALNDFNLATLPLMLLQYPYESPLVLRLETVHFIKESRRNERKAQKSRENRLAERNGEPKPYRGDGSQYGHLGASNRGHGMRAHHISIQPSISATAPMSSPLLAAQFKPNTLPDAPAQEAREVGETAPQYIPGELTVAQKAAIEQFSKDQEAAREFAALTCKHPNAEPQEVCPDCGKMMPKIISNAAELEKINDIGADDELGL